MGQIDEKVSEWRAAASARARERLNELMEARVAVQEGGGTGGARGRRVVKRQTKTGDDVTLVAALLYRPCVR
eukprot:6445019-Prymnesium_polylepis.1